MILSPKSIFPKKPPETEEEAREIGEALRQLDRPTPPVEARITSYRVKDIIPIGHTLRHPQTLLRPPKPIFVKFDPIRAILYWLFGKPIKKMAAKIAPDSIPVVEVYVVQLMMIGGYRLKLGNIGEIPLKAGVMAEWLKTKEKDILQGSEMESKDVAIDKEMSLDFYFEVKGWDTIKSLWDYFWYGTIDVKTTTNLHIDGYETEDYIAEDLDKSFEVNAEIPVLRMEWHAAKYADFEHHDAWYWSEQTGVGNLYEKHNKLDIREGQRFGGKLKVGHRGRPGWHIWGFYIKMGDNVVLWAQKRIYFNYDPDRTTYEIDVEGRFERKGKKACTNLDVVKFIWREEDSVYRMKDTDHDCYHVID